MFRLHNLLTKLFKMETKNKSVRPLNPEKVVSKMLKIAGRSRKTLATGSLPLVGNRLVVENVYDGKQRWQRGDR